MCSKSIVAATAREAYARNSFAVRFFVAMNFPHFVAGAIPAGE